MSLDAGLTYADVAWPRLGVVTHETIARKGIGKDYEPAFDQPLKDGAEFTVLSENGDWIFGHFEGIGDGWPRRRAHGSMINARLIYRRSLFQHSVLPIPIEAEQAISSLSKARSSMDTKVIALSDLQADAEGVLSLCYDSDSPSSSNCRTGA